LMFSRAEFRINSGTDSRTRNTLRALGGRCCAAAVPPRHPHTDSLRISRRCRP
jgi:hypothetical protein